MSANDDSPPTSSPAPGAEIGPRLRRYREAAGMSQEQLARPRYDPSSISKVENGRAPSLKLLEWCASKLKVPLEDLLGDDPSMYSRSRRQRAAKSSYPLAYIEMLLAAGDFPETRTRLRAMRKRLGDQTPRTHLWLSAYVAYQEGDLKRARANLERYGSPPPADNSLETAAYHWLEGLIATKEHAFGHAVDEHERALSTSAMSFIAPDFAIGVRASLEEIYLHARQFDQAYETQTEALRIYEDLSNPTRQAGKARRLAEEAKEAGDFVRAIRLIRWAEIMYRQSRAMRLALAMYLRHALSVAPSAIGHTPEHDLLAALAIAQGLDDTAARELVSALLVLVYMQRGDVVQARRYAREGLSGDATSAGKLSPLERAILALAHASLAHGDSRADEARAGLDLADRSLLEAGAISETDLALARFAYDTAVRLAESLGARQVYMSLARRALELERQYRL